MRWQKKRWSSNNTFRSTDNSGILQCFRGTTVCAARGGLDMHVPEPFLQGKQTAQKLLKKLMKCFVMTEPETRGKTSHTWHRQQYMGLTLYGIAPLWPESWLCGCHCWRSLAHCLTEVCSTWCDSLLSFHRPWQTQPQFTQLRVWLVDFSPCVSTF